MYKNIVTIMIADYSVYGPQMGATNRCLAQAELDTGITGIHTNIYIVMTYECYAKYFLCVLYY